MAPRGVMPLGQEVAAGFISADKGRVGTAKVSVNGASSKSIAARLAPGQRWLQITPHAVPSLRAVTRTGLQNISWYTGH